MKTIQWFSTPPKRCVRLSEILHQIDENVCACECFITRKNIFLEISKQRLLIRYPIVSSFIQDESKAFAFCTNRSFLEFFFQQLEQESTTTVVNISFEDKSIDEKTSALQEFITCPEPVQEWKQGYMSWETIIIPIWFKHHLQLYQPKLTSSFQWIRIASQMFGQMFLHSCLCNPLITFLRIIEPKQHTTSSQINWVQSTWNKAIGYASFHCHESEFLQPSYWKRHKLSIEDIGILVRYLSPLHIWFYLLKERVLLNNGMLRWLALKEQLQVIARTSTYDLCFQKILRRYGNSLSENTSRFLSSPFDGHCPPLPTIALTKKQLQWLLEYFGPKQSQPMANYASTAKYGPVLIRSIPYAPVRIHAGKWLFVRVERASIWEDKYGPLVSNQFKDRTFVFWKRIGKRNSSSASPYPLQTYYSFDSKVFPNQIEVWVGKQECILLYNTNQHTPYLSWGEQYETSFERLVRVPNEAFDQCFATEAQKYHQIIKRVQRLCLPS